MNKVGNSTIGIGMLFYGIWLILYNLNREVSLFIFKFWPILFVILGSEMIYRSKKDRNYLKFNYFTILICGLFIFTNMYLSFNNNFYSIGYNLNSNLENSQGYNSNNLNLGESISKIVNSKIVLNSFGKYIKLNLPNSKLQIKESVDDKITLNFNVYINKNQNINEYTIKSAKDKDGYKIIFPESYVNGINGTIYVPKNIYVNINGTNLKLIGENFNNNIDIDASNGSIKLSGDIKKSKIHILNGKVDFENKQSKDVDLSVDSGSVYFKTKDRNCKMNIEVKNGKCIINGRKTILSKFTHKLGSGNGKANIYVNSGLIDVDNKK